MNIYILKWRGKIVELGLLSNNNSVEEVGKIWIQFLLSQFSFIKSLIGMLETPEIGKLETSWQKMGNILSHQI